MNKSRAKSGAREWCVKAKMRERHLGYRGQHVSFKNGQNTANLQSEYRHETQTPTMKQLKISTFKYTNCTIQTEFACFTCLLPYVSEVISSRNSSSGNSPQAVAKLQVAHLRKWQCYNKVCKSSRHNVHLSIQLQSESPAELSWLTL